MAARSTSTRTTGTRAGSAGARRARNTPSYRFESELLSAGSLTVIGCDEVGRGALAGPVAVGMVVVDARVGRWPKGLRDSKLLPEPKREELAPLCMTWVRHHAVGLASAEEVDAYGIMACLSMAGARAFSALQASGAGWDACTIVLDGNHDYLTRSLPVPVPVVPRVKADMSCASVAAASVIAKVHRDALMIQQDAVHPGYSWSSNKGYASAAHLEAIRRLGPSPLHRRTWLKAETSSEQQTLQFAFDEPDSHIETITGGVAVDGVAAASA
ncbi:ribonuclease HII [Humibacter albus]|uniref:ribonuclease HII n=1 Tax=Humibacter albus TaxID=427754 RepID=UPI0003B436A4